MSSMVVMSCLEKLQKGDPDFRYMGLKDLQDEMKLSTFSIDADVQMRIVKALLKLLQDTHKEVQHEALNCLGPLTTKLEERQVEYACQELAKSLLDKTQETSDHAALALLRLLGSLTPSSPGTAPVCKKLMPALFTGMADNDKPNVQLRSLEVLAEVLSRLGPAVSAHHGKIQAELITLLSKGKPAARKHAVELLGRVAAASAEPLYQTLVGHVAMRLTKGDDVVEQRILVQTFDSIAKCAGHRLGRHLDKLFPLLAKCCADRGLGRDMGEEDVERTQACLLAFESMVVKCPKEVDPYLAETEAICLRYIDFDPNCVQGRGAMAVADEDEEEEEEEEEELSEEAFESDEDDDDGDDEDVSWKLRKASIRCLSAIIASRPELASSFYKEVAPALITAFEERDSNIKADVFAAFIELIRQSRSQGQTSDASMRLVEAVPAVVAAVCPQLTQKSVKTRTSAFAMLLELALACPAGTLDSHVQGLVPGLVFSLDPKKSKVEADNSLLVAALKFARALASTCDGAIMRQKVEDVVRPVIALVRAASFYKVVAEALRVVASLVKISRDGGGAVDKGFAGDVYAVVLEQLSANDIDQEVKQAAINAMGNAVAYWADLIPVAECLPILLDRMRNEITRLSAVRALTTIAASPRRPDLSPIHNAAVLELAQLCRQANRSLRQAALECLAAVTEPYGVVEHESVLHEAANLISTQDVHLARLAIDLARVMLDASPCAPPEVVRAATLPNVLTIVYSPLCTEKVLQAAISLLVALAEAGETLAEDVVAPFYAPAAEPLSKQATSAVARCVAALWTAGSAKQKSADVNRFLGEAAKESRAQVLALMCLGEIGHRESLEDVPKLKETISQGFTAPSEDVRLAASFALGNVAAGAMDAFVPYLVGLVQDKEKSPYLALHALKELIARHIAAVAKSEDAAAQMGAYSDQIWGLLFDHCQGNEEATASMVAECIGSLAALHPVKFMPALQEKAKSSSPAVRTAVAAAYKFAVSAADKAKRPGFSEALAPCIPGFLELLKDSELLVRRACLHTINFVAHNNPALLRAPLPPLLPALYTETAVKPELVRTVMVGPFPQKIDDGAENRKAAFEVMYTLLDAACDQVEMAVFLERVAEGLKDPEYDVKILCHLILTRAAGCAGSACLLILDSLAPLLRTTIHTKAKDNSVKQEEERIEELVRSALRAVYHLNRIPNCNACLKWEAFVRVDVEGGAVADKYADLRRSFGGNDSHMASMDTS